MLSYFIVNKRKYPYLNKGESMQFNLKEGLANSGPEFDSPRSLALTAKMPQLKAIAADLKIKIDASGSKLKAAEKIFARAKDLFGDRPTSIIKKETLRDDIIKKHNVKGPILGVPPIIRKTVRVVCTLDPVKYISGNRDFPPLLNYILETILDGKKSPVCITSRLFLDANIATPRGGNAWKNFLWYKAKGLLKPIMA
jgi:hypothetical protein